MPETLQLKPVEAFVYAFEQTIAITADCLREAGVDEGSIWQALRQTIDLVGRSTAEIDRRCGDVAGFNRAPRSLRAPAWLDKAAAANRS